MSILVAVLLLVLVGVLLIVLVVVVALATRELDLSRPWRVALILVGLLVALAIGLGVLRGSLSRLTDGTAAPPTSSPAITASATGR